ncbi:MAG: hypothetical protein J6S85_05975 [Methanobrevibacter sp.]|nr:hypothetical protein [Methanobrevibacter sp.]
MPHFKKGSAEAKAYMAKLRSMRGKGSYNSAALKGGKSCNSAALRGGGSYNSAALKGGRSYNSAALKGGIAPAVAALAGPAISMGINVGKKLIGGIANYFKRKKAAKAARKAAAKAYLEKKMPELKSIMEEKRKHMHDSLAEMRDRINSLKEAQS